LLASKQQQGGIVDIFQAERSPGDLVPIETAALVLKLSHWALRYRVRHGLIRFVRQDRRLFFELAELLRAVEARKNK
jgi:hypothetical protein